MKAGRGVTRVDGQRIAYRRAGTEGPPVVLLHGGGLDDATVSWRYVIDELADTHRVYAPNWPGYGESDAGGEHSIERYTSLLAGFIDRHGLERVRLGGISMGGGAALGYALANQGRVEQLLLVDSYGLGPTVPGGPLWKAAALIPGSNSATLATMGVSRETAKMGLEAVCADGGSIPADFVTDVRQRATEPAVGRAFAAFQRNEIALDGTARTDFREELSELTVPTLLVHGAEDPLFPPRWSRAAAGEIPEANCRVLPDCGHWPPRERPDRFTDLVTSYLA